MHGSDLMMCHPMHAGKLSQLPHVVVNCNMSVSDRKNQKGGF